MPQATRTRDAPPRRGLGPPPLRSPREQETHCWPSWLLDSRTQKASQKECRCSERPWMTPQRERARYRARGAGEGRDMGNF
eukprot:1260150-Rhodomonas_salina.1